MTTALRSNWDVHLFRWADKVVGRPFVWGETDCATLVRAAHVVMYGTDVFGWPTYRSKLGATKARKKVGGILPALQRVCTAVGRRFARDGDIVVITHEGEYGMGIVLGTNAVGTYPGEPVSLVPLAVVPDDATFWRLA